MTYLVLYSVLTWYVMGYVGTMWAARRLNGDWVKTDWMWACVFAGAGPIMLWIAVTQHRLPK